jgi:hypothetical protein
MDPSQVDPSHSPELRAPSGCPDLGLEGEKLHRISQRGPRPATQAELSAALFCFFCEGGGPSPASAATCGLLLLAA